MPRFLYFKLLTLEGSSACILLFDEPFGVGGMSLCTGLHLSLGMRQAAPNPREEKTQNTFVKIKIKDNRCLSFPKLSLHQNTGYTRGVNGHSPSSLTL